LGAGEGSLGEGAETTRSEQITRAYLNPVGTTGRHAWWIGAENHKARIDLASDDRELAVHEWETAQGDTAEVGVGVLDGLGVLDNNDTLADNPLKSTAIGICR
jgi:hypothetical protein